ncbi:zeta toxin family protein [Nocardia sp. NPDC052278]|uniref:zeta toxin family protein n=1 Tax=unclassified Nocardia TaxID=2637762 RepID=UPI0036B8CD8C
MSNSAPEPSSALSLERAEQIFTQGIVWLHLSEAFPSDDPRITVLLGQPSAGKTTFTKTLADSTAAPTRPVVINPHDFRGFYPDYLKKKNQPGWEEAHSAQIDYEVRRWVRMAVDYVRAIGASIIVVDDVGSRQLAADIVAQFTDSPPVTASHEVSFAFLAASDAEIELLELECHQLIYERTGHSTYTGDGSDAQLKTNILEAAQFVENEPGVGTIAIYGGLDNDVIALRHRGETGNWIHDRVEGQSRLPGAQTMSVPELVEKTHHLEWNLQQTQDWLGLHASLTVRLEPKLLPSLRRAREAAEPQLFAPALELHSDRAAVTWGHYQPVTISDMDTVVQMLQHRPRVTIGVLDFDQQPAQPTPEHRASASALNPLRAYEVVAMWNAALIATGLDDRVAVVPIGRPELDPATFNQLFHKDTYDVVLPTERVDGEPETSQHQYYWQILDRVIYAADPLIEYHRVDVQAVFEEGNDSWKRLLPRGALEVFEIVGGEDRLLIPSISVGARILSIIDDTLAPQAVLAGRSAHSDIPHRRATDYVIGTASDFGASIEAALPSVIDRQWTTEEPSRPADSPPAPGLERGPDRSR